MLQLAVDLFKTPKDSAAGLSHFQSAGSNAACVCRFAGQEHNAVLLEVLGCVESGRHVGAFRYEDNAVLYECLSAVEVEFVLSSAGESDIALDSPYCGMIGYELCGGYGFYVIADSCSSYFLDIFDYVEIDAVFVIDIAARIAHCEYFCAELHSFLTSIDCYVAGTGYYDLFACKVSAFAVERLLGNIYETESGCFRTCKASAVGQSASGEYAGVFVANSLVLTEEKTDFSSAYADVACGYVGIATHVTIEFGHETLAETHDFVVAFALGVKVATALAAADGERSQAVFEDLFKAEKLDDRQVDGGMESESALVGSDGAVELHSVTFVDVYFAVVVYPGNSEHDDSFGFDKSFEKTCFFISGIGIEHDSEAFENFGSRLMKFGLIGILLLQFLQHSVYIIHNV